VLALALSAAAEFHSDVHAVATSSVRAASAHRVLFFARETALAYAQPRGAAHVLLLEAAEQLRATHQQLVFGGAGGGAGTAVSAGVLRGPQHALLYGSVAELCAAGTAAGDVYGDLAPLCAAAAGAGVADSGA
jgi:hypothetical protein